MVLGGSGPEHLWCFWKLRGRVQGRGCGEAAREGRALRPLSGERAPRAGRWSVRAQGWVPREGPPASPGQDSGSRGLHLLRAEGTTWGWVGPMNPRQKKFLDKTSRLCPPSQKVWTEIPGDHWLKDHTKWTGHPEVTGGGCGGQRQPFLSGSPRCGDRAGPGHPPTEGARRGLGQQRELY